MKKTHKRALIESNPCNLIEVNIFKGILVPNYKELQVEFI